MSYYTAVEASNKFPKATFSFGGQIYISDNATIRGGVIRGGTIRGGTIYGGTIFGGTIRGGAIRGGIIRGGIIRGGAIYGGIIRGGIIRGGAIFGGEIRGGIIFGGAIRGGIIRETPIQIAGSRHFLNVSKISDSGIEVTIGCMTNNIKFWLDNFKTIGLNNGYTKSQIEEYGMYIKLVSEVYGLDISNAV